VPPYLIVQISDTHLTPGASPFPGGHPRNHLVTTLRHVREAGLRPDLFLFTGDLANSGDPDSYVDLAAIIDEEVEGGRARVVFVPGNHDSRAPFRRHLLGVEPDESPVNQVHWAGGLRVVSLDSSLPGQEHGVLDGATLEFLVHELSLSAPDGTVLALHHPPIPSPVRPMTAIMLENPHHLADAVAGSDVRVILCGHNHHDALGTLGSVPVWVSPSTAYRIDVLSDHAVRGLPGCGCSRIDLTDTGVIASSITVPLVQDGGPGSR